MTLRELTCRLRAAGIPEAGYEARRLLGHFTGCTPAALLAEPEKDYPGAPPEEAVDLREKRFPLQYIFGKAGFYGEEFAVSPACLIPRADTELLVERAIALLPPGAVFTDLGTGSGCIALSVLKHRPDCRAFAVDISGPALEIARKNAAALGVAARVTFCMADMCAPLPAGVARDFILSNPPYIETEVLPSLAPELAAEPRGALDGGADGMEFYRAVLANAHPRFALFEIGFDQGKRMRALGEAQGYRTAIEKDFGGNDRLAVLLA